MVSIIIPSYNSERTIYNCLQSLFNQNYDDEYEVILADSSTDRTPDIVRSHFSRVRLIHFDQKTDPGTARNAGIEKSRGEIILFIDSDCIANEDWIKQIYHSHLSYPEVAAVGGSVVNGNNSGDLVGLVGYISEFRDFIPQQPQGFVRNLPTLNISYKRWVFEKYGFFDPRYYPQEDLVFNYNITAKQEKILFIPEIRVRHLHRSKFSYYIGHQKNIGKVTAQVLRILPLPGSRIAKNRILSISIGLFLPIVKYIRTVKVLLLKNSKLLIQHPMVFVLLKIGLLYWYLGFIDGVFSKPMEGE